MSRPDYSELVGRLQGTRLEKLIALLPGDFTETFHHGDLGDWLQAIDALPDIETADYSLDEGVSIGSATACSEQQRTALEHALRGLHPWRKGPFDLFGLHVETEWRSDWKWDRVREHISPLTNRTILDVGCGNGYHAWRMAGEGARLVVGVDSHLLFTLQYWAIRKYLKEPPVYVLPLALEKLPENLQAFDTVFSMGVLYHRRDPVEHLFTLRDCLRRGGELVLETLVVEGEKGYSLIPDSRYARMPNVWFLPSIATLEQWVTKAGFREVRVVDDNWTSVDEQHTTSWMTFESLPEALDKNNPRITIEGYPAPRRAVIIAQKP